MTAFALVGAGPGPGLAAARRLGAAGHHVALLSRMADHLDALVGELDDEGIRARGLTADVLDPASLTAVLDTAAKEPGLLFVNGGSAVRPNPEVAGTSVDTTSKPRSTGLSSASGAWMPPSTTPASSSPSSRPPTPPRTTGTAFSASASPERSCAPAPRSGRC